MAVRAALADGPPAEMAAISTFSSFGYAAIGVTCWIQRAGGRRALLAVWATLAAAGSVLALVNGSLVTVGHAKALLATFGLAGAVGYVRDIARADDATDRRALVAAFRDALIVPIATAQITYFIWPNTLLNPVYDAYVHHVERILGVVVEPAVQTLYRSVAPWSQVATAAYLALPIALSITALRQPTSALKSKVLIAFVATGAVGFLLYNLCPVVGPFQSQEGAFNRLPDLAAIVPGPLIVPGRVPRNGMPSLHVAWILLILMNARPAGRGWLLGTMAFAALNVAAAMGRYQHWVMDFVVAVPLAVSLQLALVGRAGGHTLRRWGGALACVMLTLAWLIGFRTGLFTSLTAWQAWLGVIVTLLVPYLVSRTQTMKMG